MANKPINKRGFDWWLVFVYCWLMICVAFIGIVIRYLIISHVLERL